jgi:hypothetical protein
MVMETSSFGSAVVERPPASSVPEQPAAPTGGVGFSVFFREGTSADPLMLERAAAFNAKISGFEPGETRGQMVLVASQALFGDVPQTWAVWDRYGDVAVKRAPDEVVTFRPQERPQLGRWIFDQLGRGKYVVFLIPLEGPGRIAPLSVRDWSNMLWSIEAIFVACRWTH